MRDRELATIAQFQQVALERKASSELPDFNLEAICRGVGAEYLAKDRNEEVESVRRQALTVTNLWASGGRRGRRRLFAEDLFHPRRCPR
jgi:hypothetical protein